MTPTFSFVISRIINYSILYQKLNKNVAQHLFKRRLSANGIGPPVPPNFECKGDKNRNSSSKVSSLFVNPYGEKGHLSYLHRYAENQNIHKFPKSFGTSGAKTNPLTPNFFYIFRCVQAIPTTYPKIKKIVASAHCGGTSLISLFLTLW